MYPVELVFGRTGTGKSRRIAEKIKELYSINPEYEYYIIVPDQFTLTSQNYYLDNIPSTAFSQVKVFSFNYFYKHVFTHVGSGYNNMKFLSESGKIALLTKAFKAASVEFRYYSDRNFSIDLMAHLDRIISEFKRSGIDAQELEKIAILESNNKLYDISRIYYNYVILANNVLFDSNDNSSKLCELLDTNMIFENCYFFFDNFLNFTRSEMDVIVALCRQNVHVSASFPIDPEETTGNLLFDNIIKAADRLMGFLKKNNIDFYREVLKKNARYKFDILAENERRFLRNTDKPDRDFFPGPISVFKGTDFEDELEAAVCEIHKMISEGGIRYSDIVVTARDMTKYSPYLKTVFDEYDVPYFYHKRTPLMNKPLLMLVSSLLDIAIHGYDDRNVTGLIKSGFLDITREEENLFYTYLKSILITDSVFKKKFTVKTNVIEADDLDRLNKVREYIIEITSRFIADSKNRDINEISKALYSFIKSISLESKLEKLSSLYLERNENALYEETLQIYDKLIETIDELCLIMGEDRVSVEEYNELLLSSFRKGAISIIPTSVNEVLVGDAEAIPLLSPKCIFILGMSNGMFPKEKGTDPIIGEKEIQLLDKYEYKFGQSVEEFITDERYLAYSVICSSSERIWMSYSKSSGSTRSPYIDEICRLFPAVKEEISPYITNSFSHILDRVRTEKSLFGVYLKTNSKFLGDFIRDHFGEMEMKTDNQILKTETAEKLFGKNRKVSYSQTDLFFRCPFEFYLQYGLNIRNKDAQQFQIFETGTFLHDGLEYFIPKYRSIENSTEAITEHAVRFTDSYIKEIFGDSDIDHSMRAFYNILQKRLIRVVKYFYDELAVDGFLPDKVEMKFGDESGFSPLEVETNHGKVEIRGIVDRIDRYETEDKVYIRIIDYKSGKKEIDFDNIYNGIDMQLILYMDAMMKNRNKISETKEVVPGCVMYIRINPQIIKVPRTYNETSAAGLVMKQISKNGIVESEEDDKTVNELLVKENSAHGHAVTSSMKNMPEESLEKLFKHVEKKIADMNEYIYGGIIERKPVKGPKTPCQYCIYKRYCEDRVRPEDIKTEEYGKKTLDDIINETEAGENVD